MSKDNAHAYDLLRQRDSLKRTRQVWIGCLVIWGAVVGWVLFGAFNMVTDEVDAKLSWLLMWLIPVLILGAGCLATQLRLKSVETQLLNVDR